MPPSKTRNTKVSSRVLSGSLPKGYGQLVVVVVAHTGFLSSGLVPSLVLRGRCSLEDSEVTVQAAVLEPHP